MNNKILLSALLIFLSGCTTTQTSSLLAGTGSGASGLAQNAISNKTITAPVVPQYPADSTNRIYKKTTPPQLILEADELKKLDSQPTIEVLSPPPTKRYSNQKNKSIPSSAASASSSAGNPSRYKISGEDYKVLPFSNGFVERGVASWYGSDFHGEKTSNGEIYNMHSMTAAHKRLPIPSYVKVTNLKNKRNVVLRINDRGPFYADRVIDLSYAAAQKLDIHQPGTEMVQIEAIKTSGKESVYLQLGVFSNLENAQMLQRKVMENQIPEPMIKEVRLDGKQAYRVQLGPLFSAAKVNEFNAKLVKMGISEVWYVTENKI